MKNVKTNISPRITQIFTNKNFILLKNSCRSVLFVGLFLIAFPCFSQLILEDDTIPDTQTIESLDAIHIKNNYTVSPTGNLTLKAPNEIRLKPGFHAQSGSVFHAKISTTDFDDDLLLDSWESSYFDNLDETATGDYDGDGLSNIEELQHSTNPINVDTDGDDLNDDYEVSLGTDPLLANFNTPPSFINGPDITIVKNLEEQTVINWASAIIPGAIGESWQTLTFSIISNTNAGLFSVQPLIDNNGTLTFTTAENEIGITEITIKLTDNGGIANGGNNTSTSESFYITVDDVDSLSPIIVTNLPLSQDEGATSIITTNHLSASDIHTENNSINFILTSLPVNGSLFNRNNVLTSFNTFTQGEILENRITYLHNGSNTSSDDFSFNIKDVNGNSLISQTFSIIINPVDDQPPTLDVNLPLSINEGATGILSSDNLSASDTESDNNTIRYKIVEITENGTLYKNGELLNLHDSFTHDDIVNSLITYSHNDSDTFVDRFVFDLTDTSGNTLLLQEFNISIIALDNDPPTLIANLPLLVNKGASGTISSKELTATDIETDDDTIVYTLKTLPLNGILYNNSNALGIDDTFTPIDIISNYVTYTHDNSNALSDAFNFEVSDTNSNVLTNQTFTISIVSSSGRNVAYYITATNIASSITDSVDNYQSVPIGFSFPFYGNLYSTAYISTNGFISFGGGSAAFNNQNIPLSSTPNNIIAPFWDDLDPASAGDIFYDTVGTAPNRIFVAEWRNVTHYTSATDYSFEIQLEESTNKIVFLYGSMTGLYADGSAATVGIENSDGVAALKHSFDQSSISPDSTIEIRTDDGGNTYYFPTLLPLTLSVPQVAKEGDGVLLGMGNVSIGAPLTSNLVIELTANVTSELVLPVTINIPPGETSGEFNITISDDNVSDGPVNVEISAGSKDYLTDKQVLTVKDNDVSHFTWDTIPSSQPELHPFQVTISARDPDEGLATSFNSTVNLDGKIPSTVGTVEILTFVKYADTSFDGEYQHSLSAISNHFTDYVESKTTTTDPLQLATELTGKHVFLIVEQESAAASTLSSLGTSWSTVLNDFVNNDGVVIACSFITSEHEILVNSGLISLTSIGHSVESVSKSFDHALTTGIASSFLGNFIRRYSTTNGTVVLQTTSAGDAVVISRDFGAGHVVMLGTDFNAIGTDMDRILANAVQWPQNSATPIPVSPADTGNFTNGVWTGNVSVATPSDNIVLVADDGNNHRGDSNPIEIKFDADGDGMPNDWETEYLLNPSLNDALGDLDSDDLNNLDEYLNGTNPILSDSDADGMPDGWEVANSLNPIIDDADNDPDSDELINIDEYSNSTDPNDPDSDDDGLDDKTEIDITLTDANDNDHDDDGMTDGFEVRHSLVAKSVAGATDADEDPDLDGITNLDEFNIGTNPINPDTDGDGIADQQEIDLGLSPTLKDSIQDAINLLPAATASTLTIHPGIYYENLSFNGKPITLTSTNPDNPTIVESTILDGDDNGAVVSFTDGETQTSILTGFTITNGNGFPELVGYVVTKKGGGIYCLGSSPLISKCIIRNNYARNGGGIYLKDSAAQIIDCQLKENSTENGGGGGGIFAHSLSQILSLTIENSQVYENNAYTGAGVVLGSNISATIDKCQFYDNKAVYEGGAITIYSDEIITITNSIIANNIVEDFGGGSAIRINAEGTYDIKNCTFHNNKILKWGNAINVSNFGGTQGPDIRLTNTILWDNNGILWNFDAEQFENTDNQFFLSNSINITFNVDFSCVQGGFPGNGNFDSDPLFMASDLQNYRLLPTSPCIDSGTNVNVPQGDFEDEIRYDDPDVINNGSSFVDIGADEYVDEDEDNIPNYWENQYGLGPNLPNSGSDQDGDSLTNLQEFQYGTHPLFADIDGDTLNDDIEIANNTDPYSADTDKDGIPDNLDLDHISGVILLDLLDNSGGIAAPNDLSAYSTANAQGYTGALALEIQGDFILGTARVKLDGANQNFQWITLSPSMSQMWLDENLIDENTSIVFDFDSSNWLALNPHADADNNGLNNEYNALLTETDSLSFSSMSDSVFNQDYSLDNVRLLDADTNEGFQDYVESLNSTGGSGARARHSGPNGEDAQFEIDLGTFNISSQDNSACPENNNSEFCVIFERRDIISNTMNAFPADGTLHVNPGDGIKDIPYFRFTFNLEHPNSKIADDSTLALEEIFNIGSNVPLTQSGIDTWHGTNTLHFATTHITKVSDRETKVDVVIWQDKNGGSLVGLHKDLLCKINYKGDPDVLKKPTIFMDLVDMAERGDNQNDVFKIAVRLETGHEDRVVPYDIKFGIRAWPDSSSATEGSDFLRFFHPNELIWLKGSSSTITEFDVEIIDDAIVEETEEIGFTFWGLPTEFDKVNFGKSDRTAKIVDNDIKEFDIVVERVGNQSEFEEFSGNPSSRLYAIQLRNTAGESIAAPSQLVFDILNIGSALEGNNKDFQFLCAESSLNFAFPFECPQSPPGSLPCFPGNAISRGVVNLRCDVDDSTVPSTIRIEQGTNDAMLQFIILNDNIAELDETIQLNITPSSGNDPDLQINIEYRNPIFTIIDDDRPPITLTLNGSQASECDGFLKMTVQLSQETELPILFEYRTRNDVDDDATPGSDYTVVNFDPQNPAVIEQGQKEYEIQIPLINDTELEEDTIFEVFHVEIANIRYQDTHFTGASEVSQNSILIAGALIFDDDSRLPTITLDNPRVDENTTTGNLTFTASLNFASCLDITFDFNTEQVLQQPALTDIDFSQHSGNATITAGAQSVEINVPIINDAFSDNYKEESLSLVLTNIQNAITDPLSSDVVGTGTIVDDESFVLTIVDAVLVAKEGVQGTVKIKLKLNGIASEAIIIPYSFMSDTAEFGTNGDYNFLPGQTGTVQINADSDSTNVIVGINNDPIDQTGVKERLEDFVFKIEEPNNANIGTFSQARVTIVDDDNSFLEFMLDKIDEKNAITEADPVNVVTGDFYSSQSVTAPGLFPIEVKWSYSSKNYLLEDFGYGWRFNYKSFLSVSEDQDSSSGKIIHLIVSIDGSTVTYIQNDTNPNLYLPASELNDQLFIQPTKGYTTSHPLTSRIEYNPDDLCYNYHSGDGYVRRYHTTNSEKRLAYLTSVTDSEGNWISFLYNGLNWDNSEISLLHDDPFASSQAASGEASLGRMTLIENNSGSKIRLIYEYYGDTDIPLISRVSSVSALNVWLEYDNHLNLESITFSGYLEWDSFDMTPPLTDDLGIADYSFEYQFDSTNGWSTHLLTKVIRPDHDPTNPNTQDSYLRNEYDQPTRRVIEQYAPNGPNGEEVLIGKFDYTNAGQTIFTEYSGVENSIPATHRLTTYKYYTLSDPEPEKVGLIHEITNSDGQSINNTITQTWDSDRRSMSRTTPNGVETIYTYQDSNIGSNIKTETIQGDITGDGLTDLRQKEYFYYSPANPELYALNLVDYTIVRAVSNHSDVNTAPWQNLFKIDYDYLDNGRVTDEEIFEIDNGSENLLRGTEWTYFSSSELDDMGFDSTLAYLKEKRIYKLKNGKQESFVTSFLPDRFGRPFAIFKQANNGEIISNHITYYQSGNLRSVFNGPRGLKYSYDTKGRQYAVLRGHVETIFEYDTMGNVIYSKTLPSHYSTDFQYFKDFIYHSTGSLKSILLPGDTIANLPFENKYDQLGNLTEVITKTESYNPASNTFDVDTISDQFSYDFENRLSNRIRDVGGINFTNSLQYDDVNLITTETDPFQNTIESYTNGTGQPELIRDSQADANDINPETIVEYDLLGYPARQTNPEGNYVEFEYNALGELLTQTHYKRVSGTDPPEFKHVKRLDYEYNANRQLTSVRDGIDVTNQRESIFRYDGVGRLIEEIGPEPGSDELRSHVEYNYDIRLKGNFLYNFISHDRPVDIYVWRDNSGFDRARTHFEYSFLTELLATITNPDDYTTWFEYNEIDLKTVEERSLDTCTVDEIYSYRDDARPTHRTEFKYNAKGQLTHRLVEHPEGVDGTSIPEAVDTSRTYIKFSYLYYPDGRLKTVIDPKLTEFTTTYDAIGREEYRLVKSSVMTNPVAVLKFEYSTTDRGDLANPLGQLVRRIDHSGNLDLERTTEFHYDARGNLRQIKDPDQNIISTDYYLDDTLKQSLTASSKSAEFTYGVNDTVKFNNTSTLSMFQRVYNNYRELTAINIDNAGSWNNHLKFAYNGAGSKINETFYNGGLINYSSSQRTYPGNVGHWNTATNGEVTQSTFSTTPGGVMSYVGAKFIDHNHWQYPYVVDEFNSLGQPTVIDKGRSSDDPAFIWQDFDSNGNLRDKWAYKIWHDESTGQDIFDWGNTFFSEINTANAGYDGINNLNQFTADELDRSSNFTYSGPFDFLTADNEATYEYDNFTHAAVLPIPVHGNRTKRVANDNTTETYVYNKIGSTNSSVDSLDRLYLLEKQNEDPISFEYDDDGNLIAQHQHATERAWDIAVNPDIKYIWDERNNLVSIEYFQTQKIDFEYDALNRRVTKSRYIWLTSDWSSSPNNEIHTKYNNNFPIAEYNKDGLLLREMVWNPSSPGGVGGLVMIRAINDSGELQDYRPIYDYRKNIIAMMDVNGRVVERYEYDGYGRTKIFFVDPSGVENEISSSAIHSYFFATKPYDKETGLYYFSARYYDPITGRFLSPDPLLFPDGPNRYTYVANNPINSFDPFGLFGVENTLLGRISRTADGIVIAIKERNSSTSTTTNFLLEYSGDVIDGLSNLLKFGESSGQAYYLTEGDALDKLVVASDDFIRAGEIILIITGPTAKAQTPKASKVSKSTSQTKKAKKKPLVDPEEVKRSREIKNATTNRGAKNIEEVNSPGSKKGDKVFRVFGDDSPAGGASFTTVDPRTVPDFRNTAGLPSGGASGANNTGRFVIEGTLTDPSKVVLQRKALPLDGNAGGLDELIIPGGIDSGAIRIDRVSGVNPEF